MGIAPEHLNDDRLGRCLDDLAAVHDQAAHDQRTTEQLLQLTNVNLKDLNGRTLTPNQRDMLRQINTYMEQSRQATREGDVVRARNLAIKAHLLSDALTRR